MISFSNHFYQTFSLFFGQLRYCIKKFGSTNFQGFMDEFIEKYVNTNSYSHTTISRPIINALNYQFRGLKYPLIEKNQFLSLQFLINLMGSLVPTLRHHIIFYDGFFIYSTFAQTIAYQFYNYYYNSGNPFMIDEMKFMKKFTHLSDNQDVALHSYATFFNSTLIGKNLSSNREILEK